MRGRAGGATAALDALSGWLTVAACIAEGSELALPGAAAAGALSLGLGTWACAGD
ncbi:MAG TPA: hypothetical protein VMD49_11685 [Steroidobacteraceae bacterium]|nr:hypothetical protein [Steroidobacteraceae bacterium]